MEERKETLHNMTICRFCFGSDESELTSIYQKESKSVPLPIQIMSCVSIEVFSGDGLPQLICNNCKQQMMRSYVFKSNCRKAQDALKNFLLTGELIKPEILKPPQPIEQKSLTRKVEEANKSTDNDSRDVKRMKLGDGTEIITLCISHSEETPSLDETSQDSEQLSVTNVSARDVADADDDIFEESEDRAGGSQQNVDTGVFPCPRCDKTFPLEQLLDIHVKNHERERSFICRECDSKFFTKYDLAKHSQTHKNEKPFFCTVCKKVFSRETLLRRHELTHTDTPKYCCSHCEKTFVEQADLELHVKKHQKRRQFLCAKCDKSFVFKQGLERHMVSEHTNNHPYKCNYCEASFSTTIRLTRHITTHAGLRPYPCKICSRTFLLSHHLTRHMRSHYEKEPEVTLGQHKCDICSMSFRRKDSLINHSAIHSMVNLRCVICNTAFENAAMVKNHITTHLQGLPFPCEKCDYSFETEEQLIKHQVKHAEMEYEEQIEKEVISEAKKEKVTHSGSYSEDEEFEDESIDAYQENEADGKDVMHFSIDDFDNPSNLIRSTTQGTMFSQAGKRHFSDDNKDSDGQENHLRQFFKTESVELEEEEDDLAAASEPEQMDEVRIKPIIRVEGTKVYERKHPVQRKIPKFSQQPQLQRSETATLEEINEPVNIGAFSPEILGNLPSETPTNVKVGDKVVKVQKFIISKNEMKEMAKQGILEVKNGQVIMKKPGQPILNAKIKPVQQSDIDSLISNQKQNKPRIKQYERKVSTHQTTATDTN